MFLKQLALTRLPKPVLRVVRSYHYVRQIRKYSVQQEPDLEGCRWLVDPGDVVVDVGANIGVYTRFCSGFVGPSGSVHSLEPIPETFFFLERNVEALGLKNVRLYRYAASDRDDAQAAMSMPQYASGGDNIYEARLSREGEIPVKTARLDTLLADLRPRLIKCDVEGHEVAAVEGARELIQRCKPRWLIEVSDGRLFELMRSLGYASWLWDGTRFRPKSEHDKVPNYFFFHETDRVASREHDPEAITGSGAS